MLIPVINHSGIELPAMYKISVFNLMDRIYVHYFNLIVKIVYPY